MSTPYVGVSCAHDIESRVAVKTARRAAANLIVMGSPSFCDPVVTIRDALDAEYTIFRFFTYDWKFSIFGAKIFTPQQLQLDTCLHASIIERIALETFSILGASAESMAKSTKRTNAKLQIAKFP